MGVCQTINHGSKTVQQVKVFDVQAWGPESSIPESTVKGEDWLTPEVVFWPPHSYYGICTNTYTHKHTYMYATKHELKCKIKKKTELEEEGTKQKSYNCDQQFGPWEMG